MPFQGSGGWHNNQYKFMSVGAGLENNSGNRLNEEMRKNKANLALLVERGLGATLYLGGRI